MVSQNAYANTLGTLLLTMRRKGISDVDVLCDAMHDLRQEQLAEGIFSYDFFTKFGSDASSPMCVGLGQPPKECTIWSINHYLGLNRHPYVIEKVVEAVRNFGTGSGTSAMSGGTNSLHRTIEEKLRERLGKKGVMLFPTGYSANMGLLAALCQADDHVFIDEESHASIRDGVRLSLARRAVFFQHNSISDLESKLAAAERQGRGKAIVVVEGAYSMSGDLCPLRDFVKLKDRYNFLLIVDEAHSFGLYGEVGRGLCHAEGVIEQIDVVTSTFSKATASLGGFVATHPKLISYLQWTAASYGFQACFTPADAAAVLASMEVIEREPGIAAELHQKNQYMRNQLVQRGFDLRRSQSPIIPVYVNRTDKLLKICFELFKAGVFSVPLTTPVVTENEGRIRFIVNVRHTYDQIDKTVSLLHQMAEQYDLFADRKHSSEWILSGQIGAVSAADSVLPAR